MMARALATALLVAAFCVVGGADVRRLLKAPAKLNICHMNSLLVYSKNSVGQPAWGDTTSGHSQHPGDCYWGGASLPGTPCDSSTISDQTCACKDSRAGPLCSCTSTQAYDTAQKKCVDAGYTRVCDFSTTPDKCFLLFLNDAGATYSEAQARCAQEGAVLATIRSSAENNLLMAGFTAAGKADIPFDGPGSPANLPWSQAKIAAWIGLSPKPEFVTAPGSSNPADWIWLSSGQTPGINGVYSNWAANQPSRDLLEGEYQACGSIALQNGMYWAPLGKWDDLGCNLHHLHFACELAPVCQTKPCANVANGSGICQAAATNRGYSCGCNTGFVWDTNTGTCVAPTTP